MPGTMTESNKNSLDVHAWLEQMNASGGITGAPLVAIGRSLLISC